MERKRGLVTNLLYFDLSQGRLEIYSPDDLTKPKMVLQMRLQSIVAVNTIGQYLLILTRSGIQLVSKRILKKASTQRRKRKKLKSSLKGMQSD